MIAMKKIFLFGLVLFIMSCKSDSTESLDVQLYLDRFEEEANERGFTYINEIGNIEVHLVEIISFGVLGQCFRDPDDINQIHLDRTYWEGASDLEKEFVVFHELGHCLLNRGHLNDSIGDGTCLSIMYDGNSSACNLSYTLDTKEAMIDELFQ